MKSHFSRVVALGVLICASVPGQAQEGRQGGASRLPMPTVSALGYMGAFFNKVQRANSFRGELQIDRVVNDSTVSFNYKTHIQSSWKGRIEEAGAKLKFLENSTLVREEDPKQIIEGIRLSDGIKKYDFDRAQNSWTEYDQVFESPTQMFFSIREAWDNMLRLVISGEKFKIEKRTIVKQKQVIVSCGQKEPYNQEYIFDADTGNLQRWTKNLAGGISEHRWSKMEFDVPLADSLFKWKAPKGAIQIVPKKSEEGFGGNFGF